jgi:hypothetical protein
VEREPKGVGVGEILSVYNRCRTRDYQLTSYHETLINMALLHIILYYGQGPGLCYFGAPALTQFLPFQL